MFKNQSGKSITLGSLIAKGGEGEVFNVVGDEVNCIKIYYSKLRNKEKESKLKYMRHNIPSNIEGVNYKICWPKDVIYQNGEFVGYSMSKAFKDSSLPYHLCQPQIPKELSPIWHKTFSRKSALGVSARLKLCTNIVAAVKRIHDAKAYVIVDLKPQNLLITSSGKVSVIDLDSVQISDGANVIFKAPVSTPEYTPPEASELLSKKLPITIDWDIFSLGVIIYEILCGIHPYVGSAKPPNDKLNTLQEKIQNNITYLNKGRSVFNVLPNPHTTFGSFSIKLKNTIIKIFSTYELGVSNRPKLDLIGERLFEEVSLSEINYKKQQDLLKEIERENAVISNKILLKKNETCLNSLKKEQLQNAKLKSQINNLSKKPDDKNNSIIALIILVLILSIVSINLNVSNDKQKATNNSLMTEIEQLKIQSEYELTEAQSLVETLELKIENQNKEILSLQTTVVPFSISEISFRSSKGSNYGDEFKALSYYLTRYSCFYLYPTLNYNGLVSGEKTISLKYYDPENNLMVSRQSDLADGFTVQYEKYIYSGFNELELGGFGSSDDYSWELGDYRLEIWIEDKMLYSHKFSVTSY